MSMEAALDEERLGVLELLEGLNKQPPRQPRGSNSSMGSDSLNRSTSPYNAHRSPVRSMLDIANESIPRHSSIAGTTSSGITQGQQLPIRSMLDVGFPPSQSHTTAQASTTDAPHTSAIGQHPRSFSDAMSRPPEFGPRGTHGRPKGDITEGYQFSGYLQSNPGGPVAPKRNTLAGKRPSPNSMAEAVRGELTGYNPRDRGRSLGISGIGSNNKSRSPHNRLGLRSSSPGMGPAPPSNKLVMDSGLTVDKDSAYRRLSDANLALHGGSFSSLANQTRRRTDSDDKRDQRLQKDYTFTGGDHAMESSDEEATSDEEGHRGRRKGARHDTDGCHPESKTIGMGRTTGPRTAQSLMAAAEEESKCLNMLSRLDTDDRRTNDRGQGAEKVQSQVAFGA